MSGRNNALQKIKARLKDASAQSVARRLQVGKHLEERITAAQALWAASTHQEREKLLTIEVQAVRQAIQTYDQDATSTVGKFAGQANHQQKLHQSLQSLLERLRSFSRYTFYQWEGLEFTDAKQLMHHAAVLEPDLLQTQLQEQRPKGATADCLATFSKAMRQLLDDLAHSLHAQSTSFDRDAAEEFIAAVATAPCFAEVPFLYPLLLQLIPQGYLDQVPSTEQADNVTDNELHEVMDACNEVPDDQVVHTAQWLESEINKWSRPIDWQQPSALGTVDVDAFALTADGQGLALSTELLQLFEDQQLHKDGQPGSSQDVEEQDKWTRCLFSWVYGDCGSLQEVTVCPSHPSVQQVWGATATCLKHQTEVSDCMLKAKQCLKLVQKLRCAAPEVQSFLTDSSFPTLDAFTTLGPELCETFDGVSSCMVSRYRQEINAVQALTDQGMMLAQQGPHLSVVSRCQERLALANDSNKVMERCWQWRVELVQLLQTKLLVDRMRLSVFRLCLNDYSDDHPHYSTKAPTKLAASLGLLLIFGTVFKQQYKKVFLCPAICRQLDNDIQHIINKAQGLLDGSQPALWCSWSRFLCTTADRPGGRTLTGIMMQLLQRQLDQAVHAAREQRAAQAAEELLLSEEVAAGNANTFGSPKTPRASPKKKYQRKTEKKAASAVVVSTSTEAASTRKCSYSSFNDEQTRSAFAGHIEQAVNCFAVLATVDTSVTEDLDLHHVDVCGKVSSSKSSSSSWRSVAIGHPLGVSLAAAGQRAISPFATAVVAAARPRRSLSATEVRDVPAIGDHQLQPAAITAPQTHNVAGKGETNATVASTGLSPTLQSAPRRPSTPAAAPTVCDAMASAATSSSTAQCAAALPDDDGNTSTLNGTTSRRMSDDERLCVVCLDGCRTHALVHGTSAHLCLCGDCAARYDYDKLGCPMCRQTVLCAPVQLFGVRHSKS